MLEHIKKEYLTVKETFEILNELGITKSEQVLRRWIRGEVKGKKLKSTPPPKGATKVGHRIKTKDLESFIQKHVKLEKDLLVKQVPNDELQRLQEEISRLHREKESLQSQLNEKSNKNSNEKNDNDSNENSNKKMISLKSSLPLFDNAVEKKYRESVKNFKDVTEEEYERLVYTLSSFFVEKAEDAERIKQLEKENYELQLQADKIRVTKEQRQVLKGLGVSIHDILSHVNGEKAEEVVRELEVKDASGDSILVSFKYDKAMYEGYVATRETYRSNEKPLRWTLYGVKKLSTNRPMSPKKVKSITYDVIQKTFQSLYEQERNKKQAFQYLF